MGEQERADFADGNLQGLILGEAVGSGGDQRESYRLAAQLIRQLQRLPVAGSDCLTFSAASALPCRTHRMDDILRIQGKGRSGGCLSRAHGSDLGPFRQVLPGPCRFIDRLVYARAHRHLGIRCIDNGVNADL